MSNDHNSGPPDDDGMLMPVYGAPAVVPTLNGLYYGGLTVPESELPILTVDDIEMMFDETIADLKKTTHPARHAAFDTLKEEVLKRVRKSVAEQVHQFRTSRGVSR